MNKLLRIVLVLSSVFCLPFSLLYAYPEGWSDDILLTPEDVRMRTDPDVDVDEFNCVWVSWDSSSWWSGEVLYSKRDSLGNRLIPETDVSNNVSRSFSAKVAVDNSNNIQFIWHDESPQGFGVWHAKLATDGSVIVPPHLAVSGANDLIPYEVAINKYNEINVIWDESSARYNQMNYTKLDSLGNPIITKIQVSPEGVGALWPGIGVDSFANSHLGYRTDTTTATDRLTYSKLDRNGNILISNKVLGFGMLPTIIADRSQNIHMVYLKHTSSRNDICYLKLDNNGNALIPYKQLSLTQHIHNNYPHMAMDSLQYLHVVWHLEDPQGIMYAKLDTLGNFMIPPMLVVYPPEAVWPGLPRIAVDRSNRLHLVWMDQRLGSEDVYYKRGENETSVQEIEKLKVANLPKISITPNPFYGEAKIHFSFIPGCESPKIVIFDVSGRKVREFILDKTDGFIVWQGTDDAGDYLPAGVYFLCVISSIENQSIPIVLLR